VTSGPSQIWPARSSPLGRPEGAAVTYTDHWIAGSLLTLTIIIKLGLI